MWPDRPILQPYAGVNFIAPVMDYEFGKSTLDTLCVILLYTIHYKSRYEKYCTQTLAQQKQPCNGMGGRGFSMACLPWVLFSLVGTVRFKWKRRVSIFTIAWSRSVTKNMRDLFLSDSFHCKKQLQRRCSLFFATRQFFKTILERWRSFHEAKNSSW